MRKIWDNSKKFNKKGSEMYNLTMIMSSEFEKQVLEKKIINRPMFDDLTKLSQIKPEDQELV